MSFDLFRGTCNRNLHLPMLNTTREEIRCRQLYSALFFQGGFAYSRQSYIDSHFMTDFQRKPYCAIIEGSCLSFADLSSEFFEQ